jgi:hypothetical protein
MKSAEVDGVNIVHRKYYVTIIIAQFAIRDHLQAMKNPNIGRVQTKLNHAKFF